METRLFWLPPLLSLTLAACFCFDDPEVSDWDRHNRPPATAPAGTWTPNIDEKPDAGTRPDAAQKPDGRAIETGGAVDGGAPAIDGGCPGRPGSDAGPGACGVRPAPACQFNNQCGPGGRCRDGACERPCQTSGPASCGTGQVCLTGFCQTPPTSGGQCLYDRDCGGAGRTCINGSCHAGCYSDSDCGAADRCTGGICKPDTGPRPECRSSTDCADGKMCVNAVCRAPCSTDAECCVDGVLGPTCRMGYCISAHEAAPACRTNVDCSGGLSCTDAVCE